MTRMITLPARAVKVTGLCRQRDAVDRFSGGFYYRLTRVGGPNQIAGLGKLRVVEPLHNHRMMSRAGALTNHYTQSIEGPASCPKALRLSQRKVTARVPQAQAAAKCQLL